MSLLLGSRDLGLEASPVGFTLDHEVVGVGGETVDGTLGTDGIGEGGEPFVGSAVRSHDDGAGTVALGEDLVGVAAFLGVHGIEAEVIEDQQV